MIMQDATNPHNLYRMDLEYGKVVDDWRVHDDIPVKVFAPEKASSPCLHIISFWNVNSFWYRNSLK